MPKDPKNVDPVGFHHRSTRREKKAAKAEVDSKQNEAIFLEEANERLAIREENEVNFFEGRMEEGQDSRIAGEMMAKVAKDLATISARLMRNPLAAATFPLRHPLQTSKGLIKAGTTLAVAVTIAIDQYNTALEPHSDLSSGIKSGLGGKMQQKKSLSEPSKINTTKKS